MNVYFTLTNTFFMNLDFSDDQKFLQEEARKFLEKEGALLRNRNVLENESYIDTELWKKIVELGWTGIRIPEEYDGLGLGHLELCVIAEELGRFLAPVPYSSSVYLFTESIINYGSEQIKKESAGNLKSVWTSDGKSPDWYDSQAEGSSWLERATQVKNIWIPYGE